MTSAGDIAQALAGKRAQRLTDGSWLVPCPVPSHGKGRGDRSPSLRIGDGQTRLLVHCYAGCDSRDVLDELWRRDLLDDRKPPKSAPTRPVQDVEKQQRQRLQAAGRIWHEAVSIERTPGADYLKARGINIMVVPEFGGLRWHPYCPWAGGHTACLVGRYTDAMSGEPKGIWRRPVNGDKPRALGPTSGCVIRLWPDDAVISGLVLGEGIETTLAASTIKLRGTQLQPAWAAGYADNLAAFPVLHGVEALTVLVDHDPINSRTGTRPGDAAARQCAQRWAQAGCDVTLLTPKREGADFNDVVRGRQS